MNLAYGLFLASREIVDAVDSAWWTLTIVSTILTVGIMGTLFVFLVKYARKRHPDPADIPGNMKLEVLWTVLPTILAAWLFFVGYKGFELMRNPPEDAYVVECMGRQWFWEFRYPDEDVASPDLYVPVNRAVKVKVSAPETDVLHSLFIPHFRVKEDCVPGKWSFLWFEADKIGTYNIFCTEFCGKDHSRMLAKLHVLSQEDFEKWLDEKVQERYLPVDWPNASNPESPLVTVRDGPTLFKTYCASCHGENGQGGLVEGARNFQDLSPKNWKNGPKLTDIYRTLEFGLEGTQMRSFNNLAPWDRIALAHHVISFNDSPERPKSTEEDWKKLDQECQLSNPPKVSREFPIEEAIDEILKNKQGKLPNSQGQPK